MKYLSIDALRRLSAPNPPTASPSQPIDRKLVLAILGLALVLRLAVIPIRGIHHPDELWQYFEPAHRLAFGKWVAAWEYRAGIRTWLVPALLAGPMWLGDRIAPETDLYLWLPKALLAIGSLSVVVSAMLIGARLSRTHAIIAGVVTALWVDFVYFAARPLTEAISISLIFPAIAILMNSEAGKRRLAIAGLLLGLAFVVRFQLAPALAVLVLCTTWGRYRAALPAIILGGLAALAIGGAVDAAVGQVPFHWLVENFRINLIEGKSEEYGVWPTYGYGMKILAAWQVVAIVIVPLSLLGPRRFPILFVVAVVNIAVHSMIPHKEYRFILLSLALLVLLAAIASVDLTERLGKWRIACLSAFWLLMSASVGLTAQYKDSWRGSKMILDTLNDARTIKACGLATFETDPALATAYTFYHRDTPILGFAGPGALESARSTRAFDVLVTQPGYATLVDPAFKLRACRLNPLTKETLCVYQRPGGCSGHVPTGAAVNDYLARLGK